MKKLLLITLGFLSLHAKAQQLFTYGGKSVSEKDFLYSFNRNNTDSGNIKKAMQDYLDLFIRYKLKVQAAKDLRLDTMPNQKADLAGFEEQLKPLYLLDQFTLDSLVRQAYERSFSEISVAHIFFSKDKVTARERANEAYAALKNGKDFTSVATAESDDPDVNQNKGVLGFITTFTLPYLFESSIYGLQDGEYTTPIESNAGYHIFKRISSRAAVGKRSYKHILVAIPEGVNEASLQPFRSKADSIYQKVIAGISFDSLATLYSDDRSTVALGGFMDEIPTGKYDLLFEEQAKALKNTGDISPLFSTAYGFHILQLAETQKLNIDFKTAEEEWKNLVLQDERKEIAAAEMIRKSIGKHGLTANTAEKENYIAKRLSLFSPQYAALVNDFRDGNLLFEIMDKKVWGKAASDVEGMKKFHASRKEKYQWKNSVFAYTFTFQKKEDAMAAQKNFHANPSMPTLLTNITENALVDSGRYEASDLQGVGLENARPGFISDIYTNISDGSSSFHILTQKFKDPAIKTFEEARGGIINDYQQYLEDIWISNLKKKYPVVVNQVNWRNLLDKTL
jgi:parvulin-like peptidyl-prolyl isomerase